MEASSSTTSTDCVPLDMRFGLGARGGQDEGEQEVRDDTVCAPVDGIRPVGPRASPVQHHVALPDERKVDPPTLDTDLERPTDDAEPHLRTSIHVGLGIDLPVKLLAGYDRAGAVALDRVDDRHLALGEAADHAAAGRDQDR